MGRCHCSPSKAAGSIASPAASIAPTATLVGTCAWRRRHRSGTRPRPPESFPYGSPDLRRLRDGRYRVFYTIDEEGRAVQIDHVARLP